jgi:hypothetical protein
MSTLDSLPDTVVQRAAAIARGPHACPHCECPTWTEPPVPWTGLRDFVARCDWCERPISVRVDRDRIVRRGALPAHLGHAAAHDPVAELLDARGGRAFALRTLAALVPPLLAGALAVGLGGSPVLAAALVLLLVVPAALWMPALVALAWTALAERIGASGAALRRLARRAPRMAYAVEVAPGRWDQWLREGRIRSCDRVEHPDAVMRELERVLDERELRRVRRMAEHGDVPPEQLDELLLHRRLWDHGPVPGIEGRAVG